MGSLGRGSLAQLGLAGCMLDGLGPCSALGKGLVGSNVRGAANTRDTTNTESKT